MSEVKRYTVEQDAFENGCYEIECPDGEYVLASDYDALKAQRDEAIELLRMVHKHGCYGFSQVDAFLAKMEENNG